MNSKAILMKLNYIWKRLIQDLRKLIHTLKASPSMFMKRIYILKRSRIPKAILSFLLCLTLTFNILPSPASAAPAVALAPVVGEGLVTLLEYLGVIAVSGGGTYALTQAYPYISDYFTDLMNKTGKGLEEVIQMAVPPSVYYSNNKGDYYIGNTVTYPVDSASQLLLSANYLPGTYSLPVNVTGVINTGYKYGNTELAAINYTTLAKYNSSKWIIPYVETVNYTSDLLIGNRCFRINKALDGFEYFDYVTGNIIQSSGFQNNVVMTPIVGADIYMTAVDRIGGTGNFLMSNWYLSADNHLFPGSSAGLPATANVSTNITAGRYMTLGRAVDTSFSISSNADKVAHIGYLLSDGVPIFDLTLDEDKTKEIYVSPSGPTPPDDNDDDPGNDTALIPPYLWDVFETVTDFMTDKNNSTTLQQYIGNNYNYNVVDVDVNVPESFHFYFENPLNVNLGVAGSLNIDININDKTELPSISEGDGENFFGADVLDVFAGLTTNNPVIPVLSSLFGVVDPALVSVFSVSLSLSCLLALWRLLKR